MAPTNGGWGFTLASLSYVNFNADAMPQNFSANLAETMVLTTTASGGADDEPSHRPGAKQVLPVAS